MANIGRFVWYELLTTEPAAAVAFYTEVIGWKTQPWESGDYTMWVSGQGPLGGTMVLPDEAKKMGASPHWMSHVEVADVEATVAEVRRRGGRIYLEPHDVPKVGRFAILADPQGAFLSAFKPDGEMTLHDASKPGEFTWNELATIDQEAAFRFYSELFGWQRLDEHDLGPMGKYLIYGRDGTQLGGMFTKPKDAPMPPAWLYYTRVTNLDAAIARARSKGARVLNGPMEVPGGDRIAQLLDPQNVAFALHEAKAARS